MAGHFINVSYIPLHFRTLQEVQLDKYVKLIDSPGVVMAMTSGDHSSLLLRNCIKVSGSQGLQEDRSVCVCVCV